jgi:hypothetical protein
MKPGRGGRARPVQLDDGVAGSKLYVPESVALEVERLLRTYRGNKDDEGRAEEHEGIVYLGGLEVASGSVVLVALSPSAVTTIGSFRTDIDANTAVVAALGNLGMTLVGQVHSHPGTCVDHSDGDDDGALVRFPGYWSLVVPSFARSGMRPLDRCGVHLFRDGKFRRLTKMAVEMRVHLVPSSLDLRGRE